MATLSMNNNGEYNYGSDYSYGYDYSTPKQNYNYTEEHKGYNSTNETYASSSYGNPSNQSHHLPYNPELLLNNPAAQIGMQLGTQAFSAGQEYVNTNVQNIF